MSLTSQQMAISRWMSSIGEWQSCFLSRWASSSYPRRDLRHHSAHPTIPFTPSKRARFSCALPPILGFVERCSHFTGECGNGVNPFLLSDRPSLMAGMRFRNNLVALRCAAFRRLPFDLCRKEQLLALAKGFDRFADDIERTDEKRTAA